MNPYFTQEVVNARIADLHREAAQRRRAGLARSPRSRTVFMRATDRLAASMGVVTRWLEARTSGGARTVDAACCTA